MNTTFLVLGTTFGFVLSRARATDYNAILSLFRLTDLHIAGVMSMAIIVAALGLYLLRHSQARAVVGCPVELGSKPSHRWTFVAGIVFGTGWALTGA